ncbi:putative transposase [Oryzisolibacter propanilivorax]|uniref:Putative transposase n=1 Tax=Oryzisolibacter propanilivorax TaxID=1527607 RepID=A0A1G9RM32_9BURK|nr:transposase [Oryzisolibacter propanilivorax]SDM24316.1 putative transposase [Oryzisolibacter propanilivorax]
MARLPRLTVPGFPHHIIQRGNNRQAIFLDTADRECMLQLLAEQARQCKVAVHAYVLMSNHLHLLATPETAEGIPLMMQAVGRSYVRQFNRRHHRTGTLWEGRYRSTIVQTERYLLACMAYIDLNPVRAGLVVRPADHPWSSHAHLVGLRADPLVTPHALYWALGNTPFAREAAYAELVHTGLSQQDRQDLGRSVHAGWALGQPEFIAALQQKTRRRISQGRAGRPAVDMSHHQ